MLYHRIGAINKKYITSKFLWSLLSDCPTANFLKHLIRNSGNKVCRVHDWHKPNSYKSIFCYRATLFEKALSRFLVFTHYFLLLSIKILKKITTLSNVSSVKQRTIASIFAYLEYQNGIILRRNILSLRISAYHTLKTKP
jgi:hypothetical protein